MWVELKSNGIMRTWFEFSSDTIQAYVKAIGLVGVKEKTTSSGVSVPKASLRSQSGYQFTPLCALPGDDLPATPAPSPTVAPPPIDDPYTEPTATPQPTATAPGAHVKMHNIQAWNPDLVRARGRLSPRKSLRFRFQGIGTGTKQVRFAVNGKLCAKTASVEMRIGLGELVSGLPLSEEADYRIAVWADIIRRTYTVTKRASGSIHYGSPNHRRVCLALRGR